MTDLEKLLKKEIRGLKSKLKRADEKSKKEFGLRVDLINENSRLFGLCDRHDKITRGFQDMVEGLKEYDEYE